MKFKRLQALVLAVVMTLSVPSGAFPAYAEPAAPDAGLCSHHPEHTATCGYQEAVEGSPCTHVHDENCGFREAQEEIPCGKGCTDTDGDNQIDHAPDCAYQPAVEGSPCTHVHDEAYGYQEAKPETPCGYVCPLCDCICTSLCTDEAVNSDCPACSAGVANCAFSTVEVALAFGADYAEYGAGKSAELTVTGSAGGLRVERATVQIQLTEDETNMLARPLPEGFALEGTTLSFTISGGTPLSAALSVSSSGPAVFSITKEDMQISVAPEESQNSQYVAVTCAGGSLTFVEKLPTDGGYGSGTEYAAQVDDLAVLYVDSEGAPAARQENAPGFTLYYQVEGGSSTAVTEDNLPFGLTELPQITAAAGTDRWTGSVAAESVAKLPSAVLALENGVYVEKAVTWSILPTDPDGYYPGAGKLVEITDENAANYPAGLGRGWYFINDPAPFPDDTVTVADYLDNLSHDVYWADNGNSEAKRPDSLEGHYELQYAFNGSSSYQTLTESALADLGLTAMPQPKWTKQSGIWQISWNESLPSRITYSDVTGGGSTVSRDVSWRVVFTQAPQNYTMVEVTPENAGDYSSVQNQYGTYYILETSLTFTARVYQGNAGHDTDAIREAFLEQFYLDASYTGNRHQYFQLASVRDDGHFGDNADASPDLITVTVTNLWRYNLDNTRITYSIREGTPETDVDNRLTGIDSLDEGDYFAVSYDNSAVPSFSHITNTVHSGGILKLTLTGTITYKATKVWLDDDATERPDAVFELWRFRSGESYSTASLVRKADGTPYTAELSGSAEDSYTIEFPGAGDDVEALPKYDPEGHRYRYVVREYLSGANAGLYEQVFGSVAADGTVTDTLPGYSLRNDNDTFLYNGGTLSNRLKGTVPVSVTKDWKAASFQSEFGDVMVEMRLQSRYKGAKEWTDTEYTCELFDFVSENLTVTYTGSYPQYDSQGRELEYRWVEESVWQGGKVENGIYSGGAPVESDVSGDTRTFTLTQSGRKVIYKSEPAVAEGASNHTIVTNSIANVIEYDVTKEFAPEWSEDRYAGEYTFALFRTTSGAEPVRYATFTIDKDTGNAAPTIRKDVVDDALLTIEQLGEWHVLISGLPEFDSEGQQYEYLLLEQNGQPHQMDSERDENGNYFATVYNGEGEETIILVRKEWIDESDIQHRQPVTISVFDKATNERINTVELGENDNWYDLVGIGDKSVNDVYVLETKVGDTAISYPADPLPDGDELPGAVRFATLHHKYEAIYSFEKLGDFKFPCFTVTNRRLGTIDLTVEKSWKDGDGDKRDDLQAAMEKEGLDLAVRLDFAASDLPDNYEITRSGYGDDLMGDTVTISPGGETAILNKDQQNVDSIQPLDLDMAKQTLYFWNLPKYDRNGASVRYTVTEVFVDEDGNTVSESELTQNYPETAAAWEDYQSSVSAGKYIVNEDHSLDTQTFTLTNKLSATTNVSWYALWLDDFAYITGSRPDIYLNIYSRTHVEDENGNIETQTDICLRNYRWEYEEDPDDGDLSKRDFWKCTIEGLPKYDELGYEIDYFAVMNSSVTASDFDYRSVGYAPDRATVGDGVFATAESGAFDPLYEVRLENISDDPATKNYALKSGNTFVNTIYDAITYAGEKLWTNLPDSYPLVDLPTVTFTLSRSVGTDEPQSVATMTIQGSDWASLYRNGHYLFEFGHTGVNKPTADYDPETLPANESPLPRFDNKGRLYTYTLAEAIDWAGTEAETEHSSGNIFDLLSSGETFTNSYNKTGAAQLSAVKYLTVSKDSVKYPAVTMVLSRTYTTANDQPSAPETVRTLVWNAKDVANAVNTAAPAADGTVTVEHTFVFDELPVYAPNGSKYSYTITEKKDQLGGFTTWAALGDLSAGELAADAYKDRTDVSGLTADTDTDIDASFLNRPEEPPSPIQLSGTKIWNDLDNIFTLRPDKLTITLKRRANSQSGQSNAIPLHEVDINGSTVKITWDQNTETNRWTYTITGLERYAPNGMPWIYQVIETVPDHYTGTTITANQKAQDAATGDITMQDMTNTLLSNVPFKKTWVDENGVKISENILGDGIELGVTYEVQVLANATGMWQPAGEYFSAVLPGTELADRTYTGEIRGALGSDVWNSYYYGTGTGNSNSFKNLPLVIRDVGNNVITLTYRVVETAVHVYRIGETDPIYTQTYTAPTNNGTGPYAYEGAFEGSPFSPYYANGQTQANSTREHKNQFDTTSITVTKVWAGDNNDVYVTRPSTDVTRYNWEVTFLIERSTDGVSWESIPGDPYVTLYGTNDEDDNSVSQTISGLSAWAFPESGTPTLYRYRIRELQSAAVDPDRAPLDNNAPFHGSYTVTYDGLTATNTLNTTEFTAEKVWNDEETAHPAVTLELKYLSKGGDADDPTAYLPFEPAAEVRLDEGAAVTDPGERLYYAEGDWTAVWKNVPKQMLGSETDGHGNTIYKIFESVTGNYITESVTSGTTTTITNTPTVTPSVTKHWLGVTPAADVTVVLMRKTAQAQAGETVATAVLTESGNWTHTFAAQPKYDSAGNAYTCWVEETLIGGASAADTAAQGGFAISYGGSAESGFHVYNHSLGTVYVIKDWADAADPAKRPEDLQLTLQRTTETAPEESDWVTVSDVTYTWTQNGDEWTTSFAGLPQYDVETQQPYTYRVLETVPEGYAQTILVSTDGTFHFKNTLSGTVDVPVRKVWVDSNDKQGLRPAEITVELYRNGIATGTKLTLKPNAWQNFWNGLTGSASGWSGAFKDLPKYDEDGALYEYTVAEVPVPGGYIESYGRDEDGTLLVTNTAMGALTVTKNVTGNVSPDEEFHFTVTLSDNTVTGTYGDMEFREGTAEIILSGGQSLTAEGLPGGLAYTVTEQEANQGGYITESRGETGTIPAGDTAQAVFTNDLSQISIPVTKQWQDENNWDGIRPASVTIRLLADGADTGKTLVLNAENGWKGQFSGLNVYDDGEAVVYTVQEVKVDGYETAVSGSPSEGFVITNSHTPHRDPAGGTLPQTGDNAPLAVWAGLAGIAALAMVFLGVLIRRRNRKNTR